MGIVFFCQSCGSRFEVDSRMAGKKGRCKKCGQDMAIPKADQLASMVAMPALAAAPVGAGPGAPAEAGGPSWIKTASSNVGLAPLTLDRFSIGKKLAKPSPLDDADDSKPLLLAGPEISDFHGHRSKPVSAVARIWRKDVGFVQKIFRWLNESAYLVSIPFVMILLFGIAVKSRHLAIFGAIFVILLNLGRIVAGVANLAVVPLREGLNAKKMKKPLRRVIEPVLTIVLVILAFTFIPWLSSSPPGEGSYRDRVKKSFSDLENEVKDEVKNAAAGKGLGVKKLADEAKEKLKGLRSQPGDAPAGGTLPDGQPRSPEAAVDGLLKGVRDNARRTIDESQGQP
jgi:hypothetical protein